MSLIDGAYYTIAASSLIGATEFLNYGTFMGMGTTPYAYIMNRNLFESLPETQQEFLLEVFKQALWEEIIPNFPAVMDRHQPTLQDIQNGKLIVKRLSEAEYDRMYSAVEYIRDARMERVTVDPYPEIHGYIPVADR